MKLKDLTVTSTGIRVHNRNTVSNKLERGIPGLVYNGQDAHIKVENLNLMPLDYDVEICPEGIARCTSRDDRFKVMYYFMVECEEPDWL